MKGMGQFISALLVVDTFFVSYAVGFNSRRVLVVDPSLPPIVQPHAEPAVTGSGAKDAAGEKDKKADKDKKKTSGHAASASDAASNQKKHGHAKSKHAAKH